MSVLDRIRVAWVASLLLAWHATGKGQDPGLKLPRPSYAAAAANVKVCDTNQPCITTVELKHGQPNDPNGCSATWLNSAYDVYKQKKPKLVWEIKNVSGDTNSYKFHPNDGVILNPADLNDPNKDLFDHGRDSADGKKFRWKSKNKRPRVKDESHPVAEERAIRFDFHIYRENADGTQTRCAWFDPVIINRGE